MVEKYVINYAGEQSLTRFWQEAALAAMQALIAARRPEIYMINNSPGAIEDYARSTARAAFTIADEMHKQHGPCVSSRLQTEEPFVAASAGGTD